ncbi:MAG: DUF3800 domain-containing protein [Firmicutes bacterium]|uniref:DUF3800 domain-containing protein n=1 Tax=Candidatus Onthovivens merdipullorum TaxID=2840889 RepID=A0A9D9GUL0_9BACL|nr:DUF3800 domain-containing protein [Candidatus Onthovivens merdipullorum]
MSKLDDFINSSIVFAPSIKLNRTFYFDESNNIKKGIIGKEKDNNADLENLYFVLGGIATKKPLNFEELLRYSDVRQMPVDAKFHFFAFKKNKFTDAIEQSRLRKFFEYLLKNNIIIHFNVLHYFHFALSDILDSLIEEQDTNQSAAFIYYHNLQSDMTEVLYNDFNRLHNTLVSYEFPNVPLEKANAFINEILDLYTDNLCNYDLNAMENFTKELLRQIIKAKRSKNNLLFLENNKSFVIIDSVFENYLSRMIEFKDKKYFDNELFIINSLKKMGTDYKTKLNVDFWDSKEHREIQICDVICGFTARLYNFISHNSEKEIMNFCSKLNINSESEKVNIFFTNWGCGYFFGLILIII